jgi:hypothetical protein
MKPRHNLLLLGVLLLASLPCAAFAGDLALAFLVHAGEAALAGTAAWILAGHVGALLFRSGDVGQGPMAHRMARRLPWDRNIHASRKVRRTPPLRAQRLRQDRCCRACSQAVAAKLQSRLEKVPERAASGGDGGVESG